MRKLFWLLGIAFVCAAGALFVSAYIVLQTPRVTRIEPAGDARDVLPTSPITITFSMPMERAVTEQSVRIQPRVNGAFTWQDNQTLIFTPHTTLPISRTLTVQVFESARSLFRRGLAQEAHARFTTLAYPYIVSSTPPLDAQFAYTPNQLKLTFNRALAADSVRANLTLTPTLANQTLAVNENQIFIGGFFQPRTRYEIRLAKKTTDAAYALPLERDITFSLWVAEQYPHFSVLNRARVLDFKKNSAVVILAQLTNVSRLDVAVYPISQEEFDANANAPFETWYAFQPNRAPLEKKSLVTNARLDEYMRMEIALDALPAGTYYVRITSPEGAGDAQLVRVE